MSALGAPVRGTQTRALAAPRILDTGPVFLSTTCPGSFII